LYSTRYSQSIVSSVYCKPSPIPPAELFFIYSRPTLNDKKIQGRFTGILFYCYHAFRVRDCVLCYSVYEAAFLCPEQANILYSK
jgi:hypothetical protein